jgi:hypothetical protein
MRATCSSTRARTKVPDPSSQSRINGGTPEPLSRFMLHPGMAPPRESVAPDDARADFESPGEVVAGPPAVPGSGSDAVSNAPPIGRELTNLLMPSDVIFRGSRGTTTANAERPNTEATASSHMK